MVLLGNVADGIREHDAVGKPQGRVLMDVTHQLGQKEVTLNTGFVTLRKGNPQGSKGGGSGSINVVDLVEPKDCPVIFGGIGLWL